MITKNCTKSIIIGESSIMQIRWFPNYWPQSHVSPILWNKAELSHWSSLLECYLCHVHRLGTKLHLPFCLPGLMANFMTGQFILTWLWRWVLEKKIYYFIILYIIILRVWPNLGLSPPCDLCPMLEVSLGSAQAQLLPSPLRTTWACSECSRPTLAG